MAPYSGTDPSRNSAIPGLSSLSRASYVKVTGIRSPRRLLRYTADRRTLSFIGVWIALEVFAWWRPLDLSLTTVALVIATSIGSFFGAVAAHNAVHSPTFGARVLETIWRCVLSLVYGHPTSAFVPAHNLSHHDYLETTRDIMRTSKSMDAPNLINLLTFAARIGGALWKTEIGYVMFAWNRRPRWRRGLILEAVVLVVAMIALALYDWRKLIVFVMIPHAYAAWGIVTMNLLQHQGADPRSHYNHSRNFTGKLVNWWTFNNGYHTVHHQVPTLHWSRLPAGHARLVEKQMDPRLNEASLLRYVFRTFIYPAQRVAFDGGPVAVGDARPDTDWYGAPEERASRELQAVL